MADAGQKLALCSAGDFCRLLGEDEGFLNLPALVGFQCEGQKGGQRTGKIYFFRCPGSRSTNMFVTQYTDDMPPASNRRIQQGSDSEGGQIGLGKLPGPDVGMGVMSRQKRELITRTAPDSGGGSGPTADGLTARATTSSGIINRATARTRGTRARPSGRRSRR